MLNNGLSQCSLLVLKQRAFLLSKIRCFFEQRNVLEVETPILSSAGNTDINIESFSSQSIKSNGQKSFLRTSAEFPLKRLLCSHAGDIYEMGKVFRSKEISQTHNVEFTMLEWYRIGYDYQELIQEVEVLIKDLFIAFKLPVAKTKILSFTECFAKYLKINLPEIKSLELNKICEKYGYSGSVLNRDQSLDYLFATQVQPLFNKDELTFVTLYPATQAALAQINPKDINTAFRFEVFFNGFELGNGYQELINAKELEKRFEADNLYRQLNQQEKVTQDSNLLNAMQQGMPSCSGIAIGVDRLLMVLIEAKEIQQVLSFCAKDS